MPGKSGQPQGSTFLIVEELGPAKLDHIMGRMIEPEFGEPAFRAAEREEASIFASYGGKYIDTGDLLASLTEGSAQGAIRELRPNELLFGTSIFYARFQGTTGEGSHGPPSAILKASVGEAAAAALTLKDYILHGSQAELFG